MNSSTNNTMIGRFILNLFFIFFFAVSAFAQTAKSILLQERTEVSENITYKKDALGKDLQLDIYRPKKSTSEKLPVVVFLHGGAWILGDKIIPPDNYVEQTILKLIEKNYIVLSVNYRLVTDNIHFPGPVEDSKDAVRWVRKNSEKYGFDTENIGFWGVSAGAHLSLLSAYTQDNEFVGDPDLSKYSAKVNYVVDNFGPTDINRLLHTRAPQPLLFIVGSISKKIIDIRTNLAKGMTGYDIKTERKKVVEVSRTISPINYTQNTVPTLILHGNKDKIAPIRHSKRLRKMLKRAGTQHSFIIVKKGNHGFKDTDKAYQDELNEAMVNFILDQEKVNTVNLYHYKRN
ncbi:Carboxylesterase NlhH [Chryseobacterium aquaeductus]|uniref:Carboxylesterase NlhH n=1 Tax=Chryseobacterium aquaeductus TaxID=2675056 RepID=A0A9N8QR66_9FLAO|nr:alpha/beta hydrolase [Chryseobacterium aquaeductus]CAA7329982.1 Carboxylesterase NlhH [Chryseobacterium potabilaquae]CAD7800446.1 Carboxylesterase NlhH [Chryseobacterium aquaeductus]